VARFEQVDPRTATGRARELLEEVTARLGSISNMAKTMAVSPATLEGWVARTPTPRSSRARWWCGAWCWVSLSQFQDAAREATAATSKEETRDGEERAHR
jgi:hypothetical protein